MYSRCLINSRFFFLKLEQKINSTDVNSRQNRVFCQDAKQNRQIITVTPITCPQQNTENFQQAALYHRTKTK